LISSYHASNCFAPQETSANSYKGTRISDGSNYDAIRLHAFGIARNISSAEENVDIFKSERWIDEDLSVFSIRSLSSAVGRTRLDSADSEKVAHWSVRPENVPKVVRSRSADRRFCTAWQIAIKVTSYSNNHLDDMLTQGSLLVHQGSRPRRQSSA
jgi:hypothetical protein